MIKVLITQAFLTLGRKLPINQEEAKLFFDGWVSALKSIPTEDLKETFSDALSSGKPFVPGLVVTLWQEKKQASREEIKRRGSEEESPFPFHAKLVEVQSGRPYSFALKEPLACHDCGRPAEAFRVFDRGRKMFLCSYHGI